METKIQLPVDLMKEDMRKLSFVKWDRFIVNIKDKKIDLYGWIKREDTHEDFVILTYESKGEGWTISYSTSSKEFDNTIFKILQCDGEEPYKCERVEDFFKIKNVIKSKKDVTK